MSTKEALAAKAAAYQSAVSAERYAAEYITELEERLGQAYGDYDARLQNTELAFEELRGAVEAA